MVVVSTPMFDVLGIIVLVLPDKTYCDWQGTDGSVLLTAYDSSSITCYKMYSIAGIQEW